MTPSPDISLCIVTYQACDLLKDCLGSIFNRQWAHTLEVILVDNHSSDGTVEMVQSLFPSVAIIQTGGNTGYTWPMNQALKQARGSYCVQLNPDTLVMDQAFDRLYDFMESHPNVGICTPKVLNRDGTLQNQCRRSSARPWDVISYFTGLSRLYPNDARFAGYLQTFHDENETHPVEAVSGSCMFIRRQVIEKIGYLDEQFFAYQEDADFCFRARQAGWEVYYMPQASIIHYGGQGGSRVQPYRSVYQWHLSYYRYYRKNLARDYFFLFNWLFYLLMGAKLAASLVITFLRKEKIVGSRKP
jgi:GT2 family glycosyltransferase